MASEDHAVQLARLETWKKHVDDDLKEIKGMTHEIRADLNTMSRNIGRPLLSWGQTATLAVSLLGTVVALGVV